MIACVLDHVATATEDQGSAWPRYIGELGGKWVGAGDTAGFSSAQVAFANGMKLEVLEPHRVDENDFLRRFLDRRGPGAHHLTFKVADIHHAIAEVRAAGYEPVGIQTSDPQWQECFIHPKQAQGIVVQLAWDGEGEEWPAAAEPAIEPAARPATLVRVELAVADLHAARRLYVDLLGADVSLTAGDGVDLAWPGPGRVRLLDAADVGIDLASGEPGRLRALVFAVADPASVAGAEPAGEGSWRVSADRNDGLPLTLVPAAMP